MNRRLAMTSLSFLLGLVGCSIDEPTGLPNTSALARRTTTVSATEENGKIAFHRCCSNIWVMNPDGTGQINLTNTVGSVNNEPSWSPDMTKLAFQSNRDGNFEIYVMNSDGSGVTRLTSNTTNDLFPTWSPVGNKIAFQRSVPGVGTEIYTMNVDGTAQTRLTDNAVNDGSPAWSPDGTKIVYNRGAPGGDIFVMNADGTSQTQLTSGPHIEHSPFWSPDGSKIVYAFVTPTASSLEIWVMNADGTNQTSLTPTPGNDREPAWSPDGTRIVFSRDDGTGINIWMMNADGTSPTKLTNSQLPVYDSSPYWGAGDPDSDGDGISDDVDIEPTSPSRTFSDIPLGGATAGRIGLVSANTQFTITDVAAPEGVRITTTATGPLPPNARVIGSLFGKAAIFLLRVPGTYVITDPVNSFTVAVEENGPAEIELTLNGSPVLVSIAEGAKATINETTDATGALTGVSVSDVTGDAGDVTVNGTSLPPGAPPYVVPTATVSATLSVKNGKLTASGSWNPEGATGIDPKAQTVTFTAGSYSFVMSGGISGNPGGVYSFDGTLQSAPGVELKFKLKAPKGPSTSWTFDATASPVSGFVNPLTVSLQIGNVTGTTQVTASLR
jgi:dipeptidyl aminopeptidase/acylaminoacyl peptidase